MATLPSGSTQIGFVVRGATPFFFYRNTTNTSGVYDTAIYVTDGSPNGASVLFDLPASTVTPINVNNSLFFIATEPASGLDLLLYSDGTAANSRILVTAPTGTITSQGSFYNVLEAFTLTVHNPSGTSTDTLYSSDGTMAGTVALASVTYGMPADATGGITALTRLGHAFLFVLDASDAQGHQEQVLVSDGTMAGTYTALSGLTGTITLRQSTGTVVFLTVSTATTTSLYAVPTTGGSGSLVFAGPASAYNVFTISSDGSKFIVTVKPQVGAAQTLWGQLNGTGFAPAGSELLYIGPSTGTFSSANYYDQTHGTIRAPAATDSVTFNSSANFAQLIGGNGSAAFLTLNGDNVVTGSLVVGQLTAAGSGQFTIGQGGTVSATSASINQSGFVQGLLTVSGTLTTEGQLTAQQNGRIQAAALVAGSGAGSDGPLGVEAGAAIEIGGLGTAAGGSIQIDPGSTLDVFANSGGAIYGYYGSATFNGRLVDNGLIVVSPGALNTTLFFQLAPAGDPSTISGLVGSGTVILQAGVSASTAFTTNLYENNGYVAPGSLSFQLASNVTLGLGRVGLGNTVNLNGTGDVLALVHGSAANWMQATVSGFSTYDALTIDSALTSAVFAGGTLSLNNGSITVESLLLSGNYGNNFQVIALDSSDSEIVLGGTVTPGISLGTSTGDAFHWSGPLVADWNNPAGWTDDTTGSTPAAVAPGSLDQVTFATPSNIAQLISGNGNAAQLTLSGTNVVTGRLSVGTLTSYAATDSLTLQSDAGIAAGTISLSGSTTVEGTLSATGTLSLENAASAQISLVQGGHLQAAQLNLEQNGGLHTDLLSSAEIGTGNSANAGQLVIDAGALVLISGGNVNNGGTLFSGGDVIDNGSIEVSNLTGTSEITLVSASSFNALAQETLHSLSGSGTVLLDANTNVDASQGGIGAGRLSLSLAAHASMLLSQVAAGNSIALLGGHDRLTLLGTRATSASVPLYSMAAAVSGFDATDVIDIDTAVTSATYVAGSTAGTGTLVLRNGSIQVAAITLSGSYAGTSFVAAPLAAGLTQISLASAPGGATSPGTTGQYFIWNGPISGNWNVASNWQNTTTGANPAPVAPGSNDNVNFNTPVGFSQVISGNGNANSIIFNNNAFVTGTLTAKTIDSLGSIDVAAGAALVTNNGTIFNAALSGSVQASGFLTVTSSGSITLTNGASLHAAHLSMQNFTFLNQDAASSIEIGTANDAVAGALVVDAGAGIDAVAAGSVLTSGRLINNGVITISPGSQTYFGTSITTTSAPLSLSSDISGTGTIIVKDHVALDTYVNVAANGQVEAGSLSFQLGNGSLLEVSKVGAGNTFNLGGTGDAIKIAAVSGVYDMQATIAGFDPSDAILFDSALDSAAYTPGSGNTGILSITKNGTEVARLTLLGNYAGESFLLTPVVQNAVQSSEITLFQGAVSVSGGVVTVSPQANTTVSLNALLAAPAFAPSGTIDSLVLNSAGALNASGALAVNHLHITSGGNLALNAGTLAATPITLDAGATISGSGVIGGPITGSGTLVVGAGGTLEVDGALSNTSGLAYSDGKGTLLLGIGNTVVTQLQYGDAFGLTGDTVTSFALDATGTHLTLTGASHQATIALPSTFQPNGFALTNGVVTDTVPCFASGTGIATPTGRVEVQNLAVGDVVLARNSGVAEVIWIGTRTIDLTCHQTPEKVWPVRVTAGAFGQGLPNADLWLSPEHAVYVDGVLVSIGFLLNGQTIVQEPRDAITYWHIALEAHDIVYAEGLPAESFLEDDNIQEFDIVGSWSGHMPTKLPCAPKITQGLKLEAIRSRLLANVACLEEACFSLVTPGPATSKQPVVVSTLGG